MTLQFAALHKHPSHAPPKVAKLSDNLYALPGRSFTHTLIPLV